MDTKTINLKAAIDNGNRKLEALRADLQKLEQKEKNLLTQKSNINTKIRRLEHFCAQTHKALTEDKTWKEEFPQTVFYPEDQLYRGPDIYSVLTELIAPLERKM